MADQQQPMTMPIIAESLAVLDEIQAGLVAAPDVRRELVGLLGELGKHDDGDRDAVGRRAAELLRAHADVLRRFNAFIHKDVPAGEGLALTRPRRSYSRQTPAAAAAEPPEAPINVVAAAARNHHGDDGGGGRRSADHAKALAFVKRVHDTAGPVVHGRFLAVLSEAYGSEDMAADEIYERAKRAFGPAHVGLLRGFATAWLPGEREWRLQQARAPAAARQCSRRRAAAAATSLAAAGTADDGNGNGRQHDHVTAMPEMRNAKKRRSGDDDGTASGLHALHGIGESSGGGTAAQGGDDDFDYLPRSRAKKPHSGTAEFSGSAAMARVLGAAAAAAAGVHRAYSDNDNGKKPPRRRAFNGGKSSSTAATGPKQRLERDDDEVRRFRQEWEFQTNYSKLVATSDRVTELLRLARTPQGDGDGGGGDRSLEDLFPLPECREFLSSCYGDHWGEMRQVLESGGESRVPALEAIEHRLRTKEEEAVAEESRKRWQHDPDRFAQSLHVHRLAMDTLGSYSFDPNQGVEDDQRRLKGILIYRRLNSPQSLQSS